MSVFIPNGGCELVVSSNGEPKQNCVKVNRALLMVSGEIEPKKNEMFRIFMPNGFSYNGEIYHKSKSYVTYLPF